MKNPLISVIVPVYNARRTLDECVQSVTEQTYDALEILLVDDGSTDGSLDICKQWEQKDHRVRVIAKENGGAASARNAALDCCTGDYIAFVDSDDVIERDMYETQLALLLEHGVQIVCSGRYDVSENGDKTVGLCPVKQEVLSPEAFLARMFTWDHCDGSACDKLFARSVWGGLRFPQGITCEDFGIMYRVVDQANAVLMDPRPLYHYRHHSGSVTTAAFSENVFHFAVHTKDMLAFVEQNYPSILNHARYMRVRSLAYAMGSIAVESAAVRRKYQQSFREYAAELKTYRAFLKNSPLFTRKEKMLYTLVNCAPAYRLMFKIKYGRKSD